MHSHFIKLAQRMESTLSHLIRHHSLTTKLCSLAMKVLSSLLSMPLSHHWYQQAQKHGQRAATNLLQSSSAKLLTFYQQTSLFCGRGILAHLNPDSQNDGWCQALQVISDFLSLTKIPSFVDIKTLPTGHTALLGLRHSILKEAC